MAHLAARQEGVRRPEDGPNPAFLNVEDLGPIPENWDSKKIESEYNKSYREWLPQQELESAIGVPF